MKSVSATSAASDKSKVLFVLHCRVAFATIAVNIGQSDMKCDTSFLTSLRNAWHSYACVPSLCQYCSILLTPSLAHCIELVGDTLQ